MFIKTFVIIEVLIELFNYHLFKYFSLYTISLLKVKSELQDKCMGDFHDKIPDGEKRTSF